MSEGTAAARERVGVAPLEVGAMIVVSGLMLLATALHWWPISWMEVFGFITGGVCVWLIVRENIWNWPIGLMNNVVFLVLFWRGRLFADATLQLVYFALGVYGWWSWLRGGPKRADLAISRATRGEWLLVVAFVPVATWGLRLVLVASQGAAPFWDALTTALSLAAQALMCRKRLEHWYLWMVADVVYVPLYVSRDLPLTAVLYAIFFIMCLTGWRTWLARWRADRGWEVAA